MVKSRVQGKEEEMGRWGGVMKHPSPHGEIVRRVRAHLVDERLIEEMTLEEEITRGPSEGACQPRR